MSRMLKFLIVFFRMFNEELTSGSDVSLILLSDVEGFIAYRFYRVLNFLFCFVREIE